MEIPHFSVENIAKTHYLDLLSLQRWLTAALCKYEPIIFLE